LAEAALRLNKIFDVAQATAEQYVQNVAKNARTREINHESASTDTTTGEHVYGANHAHKTSRASTYAPAHAQKAVI
jgi:hypothetical protein